MQLKELEFKKEISLRSLKGCYLFYGEEGALISVYKKRMQSLLEEQHAEILKFDAKDLNFKELAEDSDTVSFFGGSRAFFIESVEITSINENDLEFIKQLVNNADENLCIVISTLGVFDVKKNSKAKKLLKMVDSKGIAVEFLQKSKEDLRDFAKSYCRKMYCDLSHSSAQLLAERCGGDLGILKTECEKLCAYCDYSGEITKKEIEIVCTQLITGDIYAISKQILKGNLSATLKEVDSLLKLKQPASQIIANLSIAFSELYQAHTARAAGVEAEQAAKELKSKFSWRMKNAYRDSSRLDGSTLLATLELLVKAERTLKSQAVVERVLLETLVVELVATLKGEKF